MPKLYSSREIIRVLERQGFICIGQRGSHLKYRKQGEKILTVIVPANKREIPRGTHRSILRQSQLSEKNFSNK